LNLVSLLNSLGVKLLIFHYPHPKNLGTDYFSAPFPKYVVWSWAAIALALVTITLILFYRDVKNKLKEKIAAAEKVKAE